MFGYIRVNQAELKVKDLERYRAYYCGLCSVIGSRYGLMARNALNYDMTFLYILYAGLYEDTEKQVGNKCLLKPFSLAGTGKISAESFGIVTESAVYAADMSFLLAYHKLMDDWLDEHRIPARLLAKRYHRRYLEVSKAYPRQHKAIVRYVKKLHRIEKAKDPDIEKAAALTGEALAEIYVREPDAWEGSLRQMGYFLGKFMYLMDAHEDVEKDELQGNYNPFLQLYREGDLTQKAEEYLKLLMGGCCRAFETLPVLINADILRNILYSGVWVSFAATAKERREGTGRHKKHRTGGGKRSRSKKEKENGSL